MSLHLWDTVECIKREQSAAPDTAPNPLKSLLNEFANYIVNWIVTGAWR